MSDSLKLTCRCGWSNHFDAAQFGLTIECPDCARAFPITNDANEFANRNVGDADFAFDEGDIAPPAPPTPTPRTNARRAAASSGGGTGRGAPKPARSASGRSNTGRSASGRSAPVRGGRGRGRVSASDATSRASAPPAWVDPRAKRGPTRSERKRLREMQKKSPMPLIVGGVVIGIIALMGYLFYQGVEDGQRVLDAQNVAHKVLKSMTGGAGAATEDQFSSENAFSELSTNIERIRKKEGAVAFELQHSSIEENLYKTTYQLNAGAKIYECKMELKYADERWTISGARVRSKARSMNR